MPLSVGVTALDVPNPKTYPYECLHIHLDLFLNLRGKVPKTYTNNSL